MSLARINAQIAASRERLRELYRQRDALVPKRRQDKKSRNLEILALFDDHGLTAMQIARKMGVSSTMVRQYLWSRGRTKRGREMLRSELKIMAETQR